MSRLALLSLIIYTAAAPLLRVSRLALDFSVFEKDAPYFFILLLGVPITPGCHSFVLLCSLGCPSFLLLFHGVPITPECHSFVLLCFLGCPPFLLFLTEVCSHGLILLQGIHLASYILFVGIYRYLACFSLFHSVLGCPLL